MSDNRPSKQLAIIGALLDLLPKGEGLRYYCNGPELVAAREAFMQLTSASDEPKASNQNIRAWLEDYASCLQALISNPDIDPVKLKQANKLLTDVVLYLRQPDEPKPQSSKTRVDLLLEIVRNSLFSRRHQFFAELERRAQAKIDMPGIRVVWPDAMTLLTDEDWNAAANHAGLSIPADET